MWKADPLYLVLSASMNSFLYHLQMILSLTVLKFAMTRMQSSCSWNMQIDL